MTPFPLPSIVSPGSVSGGCWDASVIVPGKTVGSKVIGVGTPSALASMIACLKLPGPKSFVFVTTIAQETEVPIASEIYKIIKPRMYLKLAMSLMSPPFFFERSSRS